MAKRSKRKMEIGGKPAASAAKSQGIREPSHEPSLGTVYLVVWHPLLLALLVFLVYSPSLFSDFVYDAREEILDEGFVTSLDRLPDVLSLKVLGMNLMLGNRPGQLLFMMLIAAISGKNPLCYHLCSNLLHAANTALLFVVLLRLSANEYPSLSKRDAMKIQFAAAVGTLTFALHPISVETVADISYSSDLLVMLFALLALLAAISFRPEDFRSAIITGAAGTLCSFAAVTCKESGIAVALILVAYRILFRPREAKAPWLWFLGSAIVASTAFLTARFCFAPPGHETLHYPGGSFFQALLIQPRLWVFMLGKLIWPTQFSADYTIENVSGLSLPSAVFVLTAVVLAQARLASKSRLGAMGICLFWFGLLTVSNFIPLNRILGDRFFYLPLAGIGIQLMSLFLLTLKHRTGFWLISLPCLAALLPLTALTLERQKVFTDELAFWTDTQQASPYSSRAHGGLGGVLLQSGQLDEAITQFQKALEIDPHYGLAHMNLGVALFQKGQVNEATAHFQKAVDLDPTSASAHYDLGVAFLQQGHASEAVAEFRTTLRLQPNFAAAQNDLDRAISLQSTPTPR